MPKASDAQSRIFDMKDPRCAAHSCFMEAVGWLKRKRQSCTALYWWQQAQPIRMPVSCCLLRPQSLWLCRVCVCMSMTWKGIPDV